MESKVVKDEHLLEWEKKMLRVGKSEWRGSGDTSAQIYLKVYLTLLYRVP